MFSPFRWLKNKKLNRERIIALDILRGIFIVIVAVDHFAWTPSLFIQFATDKSWLFASAAEGFFVISGMLVGYIYGPRILSHMRSTVSRIWRRAFLLYTLAVGFTFLYVIWLQFLPSYPRLEPISLDPMNLIFQTFTLQFSYGWADFLNRYAVFMLVAPGVLWLVAKGRWYVAAGVSILLWTSQQFYPFFPNFFAWQILFVGGIVLGYYLPQIEMSIKALRSRQQKVLFFGVVGTGIISYIGVVVWLYAIQFAHSISPPNLLWFFYDINFVYLTITDFLNRDTLGFLRIIVGCVWFISLFILVRRYEHSIEKMTKGVFTLLGRNSLFVYCIHGFIIFLVDSIMLPPNPPNILLNTLLGILFVTTLILLTYLKDRYSTYRKDRQL